MGQIVIRARDSVTALELVERRLGSDALILSSRSVNGQVEVVATDHAPARDAAHLDEARNDARNDALTAPAPTGSVDLWIGDAPPEGPQHDGPPQGAGIKAPVFATTPPARTLARRDTPDDGGADFAADLGRRVALRAPRVVLFGPVGAGKSIAALQLALQRLNETPGETMEIAFCGTGSRADGALLAQKSHLLGMTCTICTPDDLPPPRTGTAQIVVVSGRGASGPDLMRRASAVPDASGLLCLPAGLRADRVAALALHWAGPLTGAVLCGQGGDPDPVDRAGARAAGLTPLWASAPDLLVGGLTVQSPASAPPASPLPLFRHTSLTAEPAP